MFVNAAFVAKDGRLSLMANNNGGLIIPSSLGNSVGTLTATDVALVLEVYGSDSRMVRVLGPHGSGWISSAVLKQFQQP